MTDTAASPLHFTASLDTWTQPAEETPLMAQCLSSPSLVAQGFLPLSSHKSSSANMPKMLLLEFCCSLHNHLSLPLPCSQKNVGEGGEVLSQLERCSIRHQQVWYLLYTVPSTVESGATILILISKWKKETVLLQPILVPLLKTIPSSNWVALVGAKVMYGCATCRTAAANMSHRDKSWHWLLD